MKKEILFLGVIICLITAKCFGQNADFISIEDNSFSPPSLSPTTIIKENTLYKKDMKMAATFVVDSGTFFILKKFIEQYAELKSYASSDHNFGAIKISAGYRLDAIVTVTKTYYPESAVWSKFFLQDMSKCLTENHCDAKLLDWINNYLSKGNSLTKRVACL